MAITGPLKNLSSWLFGSGKTQRPAQRRRAATRTLAIESLEERQMMAGDTIPVTFNVPSDVSSQQFWTSIAGTLNANYKSLNSGDYVYFDKVANDYLQATSTTPQSSLVFQLSGSNPQIDLPNTPVVSGQIVMGVGSQPFVVQYTTKGIATPVPQGTNADRIYGLFEYTVDTDSVDVDMSEVDQVGFPFTISTTPAANPPGNLGVGIKQKREDMFKLYAQYIADQGPAADLFKMSVDSDKLRIMAPQNVVNYAPLAQPFQAAPALQNGGNLAPATMYYYWITGTHSHGETVPSNVQNIQTDPNTASIPRKQILLTWDAFEGATGYNVYRALVNDPTKAQLIKQTSQLTFLDSTVGNFPSKAPPTTNYSFYPQNSYFNKSLDAFFDHYRAKNSFKIDVTIAVSPTVSKTYSLMGRTFYTYKMKGTDGRSHVYTVLALKGTDPDIAGQEFLVVKPFFQENTGDMKLPPAPSWMPFPGQAPSIMVFANDGAFNTGGAQPGVNPSVLSNLQNSIVSAFNRGIATNFNIAPNNWANAPDVLFAAGKPGGSLTPDNYFYVVTATNADGETTVSRELMGRIIKDDPRQSITLKWKADDNPTKYNIYRSLTSGSGYEYLTSVVNPNPKTTVPTTAFRDDGSFKPDPSRTPFTYYAKGSNANWYAGFFHQNQTNNPTTGVSINGLAYGFAYDDQGDNSTNVQGPFDAVTIEIMPWAAAPKPPVLFDPAPNAPTSIQLLTQPLTNALGVTNRVQFKAFGPGGSTFTGGGIVNVELVGPQRETFKVHLDPISGIGTLKFRPTIAGLSYLKVYAREGRYYRSHVFSTLAASVSSEMLDMLNQQYATLSQLGDSIYQSIDQIAASMGAMVNSTQV